jgi:hypothetical protein
VVVITAAEFHCLKGEALVAAMQASSYRDIDVEPTRSQLRVRDVTL